MGFFFLWWRRRRPKEKAHMSRRSYLVPRSFFLFLGGFLSAKRTAKSMLEMSDRTETLVIRLLSRFAPTYFEGFLFSRTAGETSGRKHRKLQKRNILWASQRARKTGASDIAFALEPRDCCSKTKRAISHYFFAIFFSRPFPPFII